MKFTGLTFQFFHFDLVFFRTLMFSEVNTVAWHLVVLGRESDREFCQSVVNDSFDIFLRILARAVLIVINDTGERFVQQIYMQNVSKIILITLFINGFQRGDFHLRDKSPRLGHAGGTQVNNHILIVIIEPSRRRVVGTTVVGNRRSIALGICFNGTGLAIANHKETVIFLSPGHRFCAFGRAVLVYQ